MTAIEKRHHDSTTRHNDGGEQLREDNQIRTEKKLDADFHPIKIDGEPLSETIIRERR